MQNMRYHMDAYTSCHIYAFVPILHPSKFVFEPSHDQGDEIVMVAVEQQALQRISLVPQRGRWFAFRHQMRMSRNICYELGLGDGCWKDDESILR
jgi:hypothetical protein